MKIKALVATLFVAGVGASFALGADTPPAGTTTGTTTTSEHGKGAEKKAEKCQHLSLKGKDGSGSLTFTVARASHGAADLVGKPATFTLPAGTTLSVSGCRDASGNLKLQVLKIANSHS